MNILYGVIAALALAIGAFFFGYHQGGLSCQLKDARTVVKETDQNLKSAAADAVTVNQEAKTYAAAPLDPIAAPVVRVCRYTPADRVPAAATAGSLADGSPSVRGTPAPDPHLSAGPDIGEPVVREGHIANAQVIGLQDYIARICLAKG